MINYNPALAYRISNFSYGCINNRIMVCMELSVFINNSIWKISRLIRLTSLPFSSRLITGGFKCLFSLFKYRTRCFVFCPSPHPVLPGPPMRRWSIWPLSKRSMLCLYVNTNKTGIEYKAAIGPERYLSKKIAIKVTKCIQGAVCS